jgi:hypothetical protein
MAARHEIQPPTPCCLTIRFLPVCRAVGNTRKYAGNETTVLYYTYAVCMGGGFENHPLPPESGNVIVAAETDQGQGPSDSRTTSTRRSP